MSNLVFNKKTSFFILLLILLMIPAVYSLLINGFFESDDSGWMVIRFSAFYQALSDGQFPVRFLGMLNYGYGYPVADFLYPGFMYLAVPLRLLGLSFVSSIKIILILSMIGGGFFTYLWLRKMFDEVSALLGAVFYTYAPYHLFDLYKRGSVGEILSLAIIPFIFWQLERKSVFWLTIGIFFIILGHNTLAILFLILIFFYAGLDIFVSKNRRQIALKYFTALFLGIGMASFFWIPAVYDLKYTYFSQIQISDWSKYFADLGLITPSLVVIVFIFLLIIFKKIKIRTHRLTILFLTVSLFSLFLATSISAFVWDIIPSSFVQFPFRFLSLLIPSVAFLVACSVSVFNKKNRIILTTVLIIIAIVSAFPFLSPEIKSNKEDSFYSTNEATTTVKDEYMPIWVKDKPIKRFDNKVEFINGGEVSNLIYDSKKIYFETSDQSSKIVKVNTIYYPGWIAKVNNSETNIMFDNPQGVMEIRLPKGNNRVELFFTETPLRMLSDLMSAFAFVLLIVVNRKNVLNSRIIKR